MSEERQDFYDSKMSIDYHIIRFHAFSERWYDSRLFSCHFIVDGDPLEGQLVNSRVPGIAIYLCMYLHASVHHSGVNCLRAAFCRVHSCNQTRLAIVDHLQMVGHLKCIARRCKKYFGGQKEGLSEPP